MNRILAVIGSTMLGLVMLVACGMPAGGALPPSAHVAAICVNDDGVRVADDWCPYGDGIANGRYGWSYAPYRDGYMDVPYIGYRASPAFSRTTNIVNVNTVNIDRGSFAAEPPQGDTTDTASRITTTATGAVTTPVRPGTSTITRGGLGSTSAAKPVAGAKQTRVTGSKLGAAPASRPSAPPRKKK